MAVQDLALQLDTFAGAGCAQVFQDKLSGIRADRSGLMAALWGYDAIQPRVNTAEAKAVTEDEGKAAPR